ncbi:MAG: hypothetical protein ACPGYV_08865, partial [Phycisphaeraceae bacterium]
MMIQRFVLSVLCLAAFALPGLSSARATTTDRQVADSFVRSALSFLTYSQLVDSDEPQFLAAMLLDAALELSPDNTQAWSLRAQLAEAAGDSDAYEQALVGYLDTGVKDDRAKFNLIRYRLAQNNTLDAQYRSVEDLLNSDAGQALSGPLRSQLASFASSVADELLDERGHRKWAIEAARADPVHRVVLDHVGGAPPDPPAVTDGVASNGGRTGERADRAVHPRGEVWKGHPQHRRRQ